LNKTVSFPMARLTKMEFVNPHSWLYFEVIDADGRVTKHRCEMRSGACPATVRLVARPVQDRRAHRHHRIARSRRSGVVLPADDHVCQRHANGSIRAVCESGRWDHGGPRADQGRERESAAPSPERRPNISGDWAPEQLVMADPRGVGGGLVRLGTIANAPPGQRAGGGAGRRGAPPPGPRCTAAPH
jgi:hypothetical protein